jgi:glycerophosphoryl diester phosphodiesterase|tara:strand:+ start:3053 stop:3787 length:735 start_codon:yes stop_codon:yes gene_type:complete
MTDSIIIAHRGLDETYPENTLTAFKAALEKGMAIEIDVRGTKDDELIVLHDDTVDRTTDGEGRVAQMTLSEVKALDAGSWWGEEFAGEQIPTLMETFDVVKEYGTAETNLILEIKTLDPGCISKICDGLAVRGLLASTVGIGVIHMSVDVRRRFYGGSPDFQCASVANTAAELPGAIADPYASWIYVRYLMSAEDVQAAHDGDMKVIASGPDVMENLDNMLASAEAGADAIMAYHPQAIADRLA